MPLWLIEGLPATGKSTLARELCEAAVALGRPARWYLEESRDHPVRGGGWGEALHGGALARECLRRWSAFVADIRGDPTIHILEGTAFQSTVRFFLEFQEGGIGEYYRSFEAVVGALSPRMVYLRPDDAMEHSRYASSLRGPHWSTKVAGYLEAQPYSRSRGWRGLDGMHCFWADYAQVCDALVAAASVPTLQARFVPGTWGPTTAAARRFLLDAPGA